MKGVLVSVFLFSFFWFLVFCLVLGIESRALYILRRCSSPELHFSSEFVCSERKIFQVKKQGIGLEAPAYQVQSLSSNPSAAKRKKKQGVEVNGARTEGSSSRLSTSFPLLPAPAPGGPSMEWEYQGYPWPEWGDGSRGQSEEEKDSIPIPD